VQALEHQTGLFPTPPPPPQSFTHYPGDGGFSTSDGSDTGGGGGLDRYASPPTRARASEASAKKN
jgi:hypothetical protein